MNENDFHNTNDRPEDRAIDWARQPVAARLRALADDELPPAEATDLRNELDAEAIARADAFERRLRERCAACMSDAQTPADLRDRVVSALRAEESGAHGSGDAPSVEPMPATVISRTDRSFWAGGRAMLGVAAAVALAAVVWVMAPTASTGDPSVLLQQAALRAASEHSGCTVNPDYFENTMARVGDGLTESTGAEFISKQIGDLPVKLALGGAGYTLSAIGECDLPGPGETVHLLYEPVDPNSSRPVSLFIQEASSGHDWMSKGALYTSGLEKAPYVRVWRTEGVVYYMVTDCPVSCEKAEAAYALTGERITL